MVHVKDCGYVDPDKMVQVSVVFGCNGSITRKDWFRKVQILPLKKAINITGTNEMLKAQLENIACQNVTVNNIN